MIAGTIVLEDTTITFAEEEGTIRYTVANSIENAVETKTVRGEKFMAAIGIATRYSGEPLTKEEEEWANEVQPNNPNLRFIP